MSFLVALNCYKYVLIGGEYGMSSIGGIVDMAITRKDAATPQHKSNLCNIRGTFAVEGMTISKSTRSNLDRIASGQTSYQQVLTELRMKHEKRI